jgi:hypothetical protein
MTNENFTNTIIILIIHVMNALNIVQHAIILIKTMAMIKIN